MDWQRIVYILPGILLGLTVHEYCHAFAAWKLGDSTARNQGRVTLNPIRHIDPIGFLLILVAGFGWAKPVQFDPAQLRDFRRDRAIIALAGPLSNLALAILLSLVIRTMLHLHDDFSGMSLTILNIVFHAAFINFMLFVF
ncbi:MAG: site-2 protease family protein, partial [Treponema sp.]|nr:site-2 protease family protein [Treponema sp.]